MAVDFGSFPQALGQNVQRIDPQTGKALRPTLDNEFFLHEWVKANTQALDDAVIQVQADVTDALALGNQATAYGRMRLVAGGSAPSGVAVRFSVELEIVAGSDTWAETGLFLDLMLDGTSRFVVIANQFTLIDPGYAGGDATQVFNYLSGVFRFNVPVLLDTGEIAGNAITDTAANAGVISSSSLSVSKSFYGGTTALVQVSINPSATLVGGSATGWAATLRTYPFYVDGSAVDSLVAYDVPVGSNTATVRDAIGTGTTDVVGSLVWAPSPVSRFFIVPSLSAGVHSFAVGEPGGNVVNASIAVTEFKDQR